MAKDNQDQIQLHLDSTEKSSGPVECLGMTFENDEARREYFLDILREKLKDPEFRKIEGFPIGEDEDILALSDPPYYTACPNPFIEDFIKHYGKPYDPETDDYRREPFASDTTSGKSHPIYTAHSYHSKIPHEAIMPCIMHYTEPGEVILDGFSGSGMTGVAAQLCGQPEAEFKTQLEDEWKKNGYGQPSWGSRCPILIDISPVANFIAYNLNRDVSVDGFEEATKRFFDKIESELSWMYETYHADGKTKGRINYVVWSEVYTCPNCASDIVFMEEAYDPKKRKFAKEFTCPECKVSLTTRTANHKFTTILDQATGNRIKKLVYVPYEIEYTIPGDKTKYRKSLDDFDKKLITELAEDVPSDWFPTSPLPLDQMLHNSALGPKGVSNYHNFYMPRALHALSVMWRLANECEDTRIRGFLKFMVEQVFWGFSLLARFVPSHFSQVNQYLPGVFYIPPNVVEISPWYILNGKEKRLRRLLNDGLLPHSQSFSVSTASSLNIPITESSIDYIYTDLPFGNFVPYGDLNLVIESWHNIFSNLTSEVLVDVKRNKPIPVYGTLMKEAFEEYYRVLKPGRWATIVFHNSKNSIWNVLQEAIGSAGFVIADVRTMDRGQGSFKQVTTSAAVKHDLIISAYKPNGGFEKQFKLAAGTEEGVWEFMRAHLQQLPVTVVKENRIEVILGRQNFMLFDRMVAFHVQRGIMVPMSASEFYQGLTERFPERDGMFFLPEQVADYDRKRLHVSEVDQLDLFISDESSAILWLHNHLKARPQTFQEIHPQFLQELGGWVKHEKLLELSELLKENFLEYDGKGYVPSQIHTYLSSNWHELRKLTKDDPALKAKAKDRWYVPDPNKAGDLEKLRERTLLKEFDEYIESKQRRLKVFRLEAVRAGFKKAWQDRDYQTIIDVANKIPDSVLQEDPKLLMWYDQAITRMGEG